MSPRLLACIFAFSACATVEQPRLAFRDTGLVTAARDLECSEGQLQVSVINRADAPGCVHSKVVVLGCERQATYECDATTGWYRSSTIETLGQPTASRN